MPQITCSDCGLRRIVMLRVTGPGSLLPGWLEKDVLQATLVCGKCQARTHYVQEGNSVVFAPDKNAYGVLGKEFPEDVRDIFSEAELSYYGTAYRAAATMCRACVERMLVHGGFKKGKLEKKIEEAKEAKALDEREYLLAQGFRSVGNDAVHEKLTVNQGDIPAVLSAAVTIVNKLLPALQSKRDHSGE